MKKKKKHRTMSLSDYFNGLETQPPTPTPTPLPENSDK